MEKLNEQNTLLTQQQVAAEQRILEQTNLQTNKILESLNAKNAAPTPVVNGNSEAAAVNAFLTTKMPPKPLSFAEPRGAPGGYETATLTGTTQGNSNPENLAAADDYASCGKPLEAGVDSGIPVVDYFRGYRPRTVYSQGLPQIQHFTGGDDRSFLEWFSMLKRAVPDFQDIHDSQRWNHVASRLKNPALAYWLTLEGIFQMLIRCCDRRNGSNLPRPHGLRHSDENHDGYEH